MKGVFIMMKRFLATLMAFCMFLGIAPAAFAAEVDSPATFEETGEVIIVGSNGEATVDLPVSPEGIEIVPYGGGTETWSNTSGWVNVGSFTMEGNNLTPVKTVGVNGYNLGVRVNSYQCSKPVILTVCIRRAYSTTPIAGSTNVSSLGTSGTNIDTGLISVNKGDQIQVSFRITDANGNYDDDLQCKITYSYRYVQKF